MNKAQIQSITKQEKFLLLSIKPKFSKLIFEKKKTVELRKRRPKFSVKYALIYESSPSKKIIGLISIKQIRIIKLGVLRKYAKKAMVDEVFVKKYYCKYKYGVIIEIEKAIRFNKHIPAKKMKELNLNIPQDYRYVTKEQILPLFHNV